MKPKQKHELHARNKHKGHYNFEELISKHPKLKTFVRPNKYNVNSIDFANPNAVKELNIALLVQQYNIENWNIPVGYLCPPIPGRADYIHYIADLLKVSSNDKVKCLDIGTGANCIYPIIGVMEYNWSFRATDIDEKAIINAQKIIDSNKILSDNIELRLQSDTNLFFKNIINKNEKFDVTVCNPPFHKSLADAQKSTLRKLNNLSKERVKEITLNFGGQNNELFCKGGEKQFVINMILESKQFAKSVKWFTTLVSKQEHLPAIYKTLENVKVSKIETIKMGQGNKISRIVCWSYHYNTNFRNY